MIDVNVESKPQDVALAEGEEAKPSDCEQESDAGPQRSGDPISELARLAANKGQMRTGERAFVFEGSGKVDAKKGEEKANASPSGSRTGMSPVIGGVRVMPEANEELQKIL
ncbi:hypothetical protein Emag_004108 [Eimeria magna]